MFVMIQQSTKSSPLKHPLRSDLANALIESILHKHKVCFQQIWGAEGGCVIKSVLTNSSNNQ